MDFKENNLISRENESKKILLKYPDRLPIIINKCNNSNDLLTIKKNKYLVEKDMKFMSFIYIIRKNIKIDDSKALFVLVDNSLVNGNKTMGELYEEYKDVDGFLYITYTSENTFG